MKNSNFIGSILFWKSLLEEELISPEESEKEDENQENAEDFVLYYGFNVVDFQRQIETNKIEIESINYQMKRLQEKIDELKEEKSNMKN